MTLDAQFQSLHSIVCSIIGVNYESTFTRTRRREVVESRQLTMYILKNKLALNVGLSLERIGSLFCSFKNPKGFDHATVLHSSNNIQNLLDTNCYTQNNLLFKDVLKEVIFQYNNKSGTITGFPFENKVPKKQIIWALTGV
jgi:chromosomal replication initiation ATPase DnaA